MTAGDEVENDPVSVLEVPIEYGDGNTTGAATVGEYLRDTVLRLWQAFNGGGEFDGTAPLGYQDWKAPIEVGLIKAGVVGGTLDEDGFVRSVNDAAVDKLIKDALTELFACCGGGC